MVGPTYLYLRRYERFCHPSNAFSIFLQYEFERRKYAQDLIDFDKKFSALFSGKPLTKDNKDGVSHEEFLKCGANRSISDGFTR